MFTQITHYFSLLVRNDSMGGDEPGAQTCGGLPLSTCIPVIVAVVLVVVLGAGTAVLIWYRKYRCNTSSAGVIWNIRCHSSASSNGRLPSFPKGSSMAVRKLNTFTKLLDPRHFAKTPQRTVSVNIFIQPFKTLLSTWLLFSFMVPSLLSPLKNPQLTSIWKVVHVCSGISDRTAIYPANWTLFLVHPKTTKPQQICFPPYVVASLRFLHPHKMSMSIYFLNTL